MALFKQVGRPIEFGDVAVTYDEVDELRGELMRSLPLSRQRPSLQMTDNKTVIKQGFYNSGYFSDLAGDYNTTHEKLFATTTYGSGPDGWAMSLHHVKSRDSQRGHKIYKTYEFDTLQGELYVAKKRVRLINELTRIAIINGEPYNENYDTQRKMVEYRIEPKDLDEIRHLVSRMLKRAAVGRGAHER